MRVLVVLFWSLLILIGYKNDYFGITSKPEVIPYQIQSDSSGRKYTRGNKSPYVVFGETYEVLPNSVGFQEIGVASWYGGKFHGRLTSSGETYDMFKLSAAHKSLPLPTTVEVTNLENGKHIILTINDRGPFHGERVIDLSFETAGKLGFAEKGTALVSVKALDAVNYPDSYHQKYQKSPYLQVGVFVDSDGAERQPASLFRFCHWLNNAA